MYLAIVSCTLHHVPAALRPSQHLWVTDDPRCTHRCPSPTPEGIVLVPLWIVFLIMVQNEAPCNSIKFWRSRQQRGSEKR